MPATYNADFVVIGAGIMGLSIARELVKRYPDVSINILEKELEIGKHASGRNSGVLHSGIYYEENTLKAKVCAIGAKRLSDYCYNNNLPIKKTGKLVVPVNKSEMNSLNIFYERARKLGHRAEILDEKGLSDIEPDVRKGNALYLQDVSVIDSAEVLKHIGTELKLNKSVSLCTDVHIRHILPENNTIQTDNGEYRYKVLINCAGLFADKIAHMCDTGKEYAIVPFKGDYYRLSDKSAVRLHHHVYPVPDTRFTFLGIHFTTTADNHTYIGPSALPALGRENYNGMENIDLAEFPVNAGRLLRLYAAGNSAFRYHVYREISYLKKINFTRAASALVPALRESDLEKCDKVGIRAQLYNKKTNSLVMDFVVKKNENTIHVLNAISPAFTSAFSFSEYIVDNYIN